MKSSIPLGQHKGHNSRKRLHVIAPTEPYLL